MTQQSSQEQVQPSVAQWETGELRLQSETETETNQLQHYNIENNRNYKAILI